MAGFGRQLDAASPNWTLRGRMNDELLGRQSAFDEAKLLYRMIGEETTIEEIRELIVVSPRVETVLRAFVRANPDDGEWIEATLKFRSDVLEEFNRLVRDGIPATPLAEIADSPLSLFTDALAFAQA